MQEATLLTDAATIKQACCDWAHERGWVILDRGDNGPCRFKLSHIPLIVPQCYMEVVCLPADGGYAVQFRSNVGGAYGSGMEADADGLAESFARGVCRALASRGVHVQPTWLAETRQSRWMSDRLARLSEPVYWGLYAVGILLGIALGLAYWNQYVGLAAFCCLVIPTALAGMVRYRTAGMSIKVPLTMYLACAPAGVIAFAVLAHYR